MVVWTNVASMMMVGNAMLLVLNLPMVRLFINLLKVPPPLLYGGVVAFVMLGAYALTFSFFSLLLLVVVGLALTPSGGHLVREDVHHGKSASGVHS